MIFNTFWDSSHELKQKTENFSGKVLQTSVATESSSQRQTLVCIYKPTKDIAMRKNKKKIVITGTAPKERNPIARMLCEQGQFKNKTEPNKKKMIQKFDLKKEGWD